MHQALHFNDNISTSAYTSVYPHANHHGIHTHAHHLQMLLATLMRLSLHLYMSQQYRDMNVHQQVCRKRCIHAFDEHMLCVAVTVPVSIHMPTHMSKLLSLHMHGCAAVCTQGHAHF